MDQQPQQLKIAVCGHIDHGKSTLIGRLLLDTRSLPDDKIKELKIIGRTFGPQTQLAHLSDQLKEERERNITIETTQIFFKTRKRPFCLIDTPGHLEFIRNMLTGTSQAQAALLLIDINEGIADQTRRHAYLFNFLAIPQIIVLVNKMDLVQYSQNHFEKIKMQLSSLFADLSVKPLAIIPISAQEGQNISSTPKKMPWYHEPYLLKALDALADGPEENTKGPLRLAVQDVYLHGDEKIFVGRIACGSLKQGQKLIVLPQKSPAVIKSIKVFDENKKSAAAGESIGVTLMTDTAIKRGDILCADIIPAEKTKSFEGNIFWLSPKELAQEDRVVVQCSTQKFDCKITRIIQAMDTADLKITEKNPRSLKQNQAGLIEFTVLSPAVLEKYSHIPELGRYSIENPDELCGAGTVLSVAKE